MTHNHNATGIGEEMFKGFQNVQAAKSEFGLAWLN